MMKKIIALTLITISTFSAIPMNESQAGIAIIGHSISNDDNRFGSIVEFGSGLVIEATGLALGGLSLITGNSIVGYTSIGLIVLDTKNNASIASQLATRYSFIDDSAVIESLANEVQTQYTRTTPNHSMAIIRLDEASIRRILAPADLTNNEINAVVLDLH